VVPLNRNPLKQLLPLKRKDPLKKNTILEKNWAEAVFP
jgi:hypothetical protein